MTMAHDPISPRNAIKRIVVQYLPVAGAKHYEADRSVSSYFSTHHYLFRACQWLDEE